MQGKKRIPIRRHRIKVPFKPKSKEYMQGFHDCLDRLATLCFHETSIMLSLIWQEKYMREKTVWMLTPKAIQYFKTIRGAK